MEPSHFLIVTTTTTTTTTTGETFFRQSSCSSKPTYVLQWTEKPKKQNKFLVWLASNMMFLRRNRVLLSLKEETGLNLRQGLVPRTPACTDLQYNWLILLAGKCITNAGNEPNKPCIFPWYYSHDTVPKLHTACADPNGSGYNWCPTEVVDGTYISGSGHWGKCDVDLPECNAIGTPNPPLTDYPQYVKYTRCNTDFNTTLEGKSNTPDDTMTLDTDIEPCRLLCAEKGSPGFVFSSNSKGCYCVNNYVTSSHAYYTSGTTSCYGTIQWLFPNG